MYQIRLIATRNNQNAPFYWESQDPEIVEFLQAIETKSATLSHLYSGKNTIIGPTGLLYIVEWFFNSEEDWNTYKAEMMSGLPDFVAKRTEYFLANDHRLFIQILDGDGNVLYEAVTVADSTIAIPE